MPSPAPRRPARPVQEGELARLVLEHYGLPQAQVTLLREGDNHVFRVDVAPGDTYVLRLHTAGQHSARALHSELDWLDRLTGTAQLPVPRPVRSASGAWTVPLAFLEAESAPQLRCSVLSWLEGAPLPEGQEFTREQAEQAGQLLAQLHLQAERFQAFKGSERPCYDNAYFLTCAQQLQWNLASSVEARRLERLIESLTRLLQKLGPLADLPGGFGLIHADPHPGNFLQQERGLALIDFDRCGWGPFQLDLAHADLALDSAGRAALIAGYTRFRSLPPGHRELLKALRVLAVVENLSFLAQRPHELPFVLESLPVVESELVVLSDQ
ncbi:phosphotransferase enzyme family protein [Deinococcus navajonensis]|uniref:Phosphotransferase enzyme family protein n=1 Tax=Deinococcus navajonensis TaxID=309884 RepID=A0ABV8XI22_9DEIO